MRVLWFCNIILPAVAKEINADTPCMGGWLTGAFLAVQEKVRLGICFPYHEKICNNRNKIFSFYSFRNKKTYEDIVKIIEDFSPDLIHIWGTESAHCNAVLTAAKNKGLIERCIISIQGLVSVIQMHYYASLPLGVIAGWSFRDIIKFDNIVCQKIRFYRKGKKEIESLLMAKNVIGRTRWDKICIKRINPEIKYYFCNEILRPYFYKKAGSWNARDCEQFSIFVSQSYYTIKGFHLMLESFVDVLKEFPTAKLYTTGKNILSESIKMKLRLSYYSLYIKKIITDNHLNNSVFFLGRLNEEEICNRILKSNVFVSCSSIENSSNSIGEAMLLGTPVVASDVGGTKSFFHDHKDGFLYPYDEPYISASYIKRIFNNPKLAMFFSKNAVSHAQETFNSNHNGKKLIQIYNSIAERS